MMATPDDIIEAKRIANARAQAQAAAKSVDPFALAAQLAAAPKATGPSKADLDAISAAKTSATAAQAAAKAQAEALAKAVGAKIDPATGKIISGTMTTPAGVYTFAGATGPSGPTGPTGPDGSGSGSTGGGAATLISTFTDPTTGDIMGAYSDGSTRLISKGTKILDAQKAAEAEAKAKAARGESAFQLFRDYLNQYGLGALAADVEKYKLDGLSNDELLIKLRTESDAYKKRFAANAQRIAKGLRALSEAEYVQKEDAYQNIMRNYGLPDTYYAKGELGVQPGFEKLIANDVSAVELEDRIQTAQNRVLNAAPEVTQALKSFYPDISNGDILAYALDPQNALANIKRKVGAAEIGGAALQAGLQTGLSRAEELQKYGVTQAQAEQGYKTIGGGLQRGSELASIYSQSPYTQTTAEQEVFGIPGATEAAQKRKKLIGLERATFGGQTGAGGAFERERAGGY